eukprot:gene13048-biopygen3517
MSRVRRLRRLARLPRSPQFLNTWLCITLWPAYTFRGARLRAQVFVDRVRGQGERGAPGRAMTDTRRCWHRRIHADAGIDGYTPMLASTDTRRCWHRGARSPTQQCGRRRGIAETAVSAGGARSRTQQCRQRCTAMDTAMSATVDGRGRSNVGSDALSRAR